MTLLLDFSSVFVIVTAAMLAVIVVQYAHHCN